MAEIKVTPQEVSRKADSLQQFNQQFRAEVEKLAGYVGQLNNMWEGQAKDAFNNAFNTDREKMSRFAENIEKYAAALREIASQYENAEQTAYSLASQRSS